MHTHTWLIQSHHSTSTGTVTYTHCQCGAQAMSLTRDTEDLLVAVVKNV